MAAGDWLEDAFAAPGASGLVDWIRTWSASEPVGALPLLLSGRTSISRREANLTDVSRLPPALCGAESVLLVGPPMSGKYDLLLRLLDDWTDEPILVSTGRTAPRTREDFETLLDGDGERLFVIDCATREQGIDAEDSYRARYVDSPGNLTDIGVRFTNLADDLEGSTDHAVGLYSVSHLLMYWQPDRVYQFLRTFCSQAAGNGWPFAATINSTAHDEQVLHTLYEPFDQIVETRVDDGDREFRVRTRTEAPSEWIVL